MFGNNIIKFKATCYKITALRNFILSTLEAYETSRHFTTT